MTIAIVLVLLVLGSLIFHYLSPWYFTPLASNWKGMDETNPFSAHWENDLLSHLKTDTKVVFILLYLK